MHRLRATILIHAPVDVCYREWSHFEQFPQIFKHIINVEKTDINRWRWTLSGPGHHDVHWDAMIDQMSHDKIIRWHTPPEVEVASSGSINFTSPTDETTRVDVDMAYEPPYGLLGELFADATQHPDSILDRELCRFRDFIEDQHSDYHMRGPSHTDAGIRKEMALEREIRKP